MSFSTMRHARSLAAASALLLLAGCVDTPPYVAHSTVVVPPPPAGTYGANDPAPPLASRMTAITDRHTSAVPGHPDCVDYAVTGTLDGAVRTVTGRSCRVGDGALAVTERNPVTGAVTHTTYPAPPPEAAGGTVVAGPTYAYAYPAPYPVYVGGGPFVADPFFFGYPFVGLGFGFGFGGYYGGFRGYHGYGYGYHGYGFHGGGFHGGYRR